MRTPRFARPLALAAVVAAGAFALIAGPGIAHADVSEPENRYPCDLFDPDCDPLQYSPPQYNAVGRDRDQDAAQAEAEDLAASHCVGHAYDVVRVRVSEQGNVTVWTLTYTCG